MEAPAGRRCGAVNGAKTGRPSPLEAAGSVGSRATPAGWAACAAHATGLPSGQPAQRCEVLPG